MGDEGFPSCVGCLDLFHRLPIGTLLTFCFYSISILVLLYSGCEYVFWARSLKTDILKDEDNGFSLSDLHIVLGAFIFLINAGVEILAVCAAFFQPNENDAAWKKKLGGKFTFLALFIISILLIAFWILSANSLSGLCETYILDRKNCKEFYRHDPDVHVLCISITHLATEESVTLLCNKTDVTSYCSLYVDNFTAHCFSMLLGTNAITLSMALLLSCLAFNMSAARLETRIENFQSIRMRRV